MLMVLITKAPHRTVTCFEIDSKWKLIVHHNIIYSFFVIKNGISDCFTETVCYYWPVFFSLSLTISSKDLISGQPRIDGNLNSSIDLLWKNVGKAMSKRELSERKSLDLSTGLLLVGWLLNLKSRVRWPGIEGNNLLMYWFWLWPLAFLFRKPEVFLNCLAAGHTFLFSYPSPMKTSKIWMQKNTLDILQGNGYHVFTCSFSCSMNVHAFLSGIVVSPIYCILAILAQEKRSSKVNSRRMGANLTVYFAM